MIIQINDDWRIASDPHQWIIQKHRQHEGNDAWAPIAYFADLDRACVALHRRQVRILAVLVDNLEGFRLSPRGSRGMMEVGSQPCI